MGENTRFVYLIGGELIMEFDGSTSNLKKEYVYGGGMQATIDSTNGTQYTTTDILGSPRIVTNSSGSVVSRHDYLPFGEELFAGTGGRTTGMGFSSSDGLRMKFTGYERDTETGLDFAQARYYSNTRGRFTGADPVTASANAHRPQTWNRYTYAQSFTYDSLNRLANAQENSGASWTQTNGYDQYGNRWIDEDTFCSSALLGAGPK